LVCFLTTFTNPGLHLYGRDVIFASARDFSVNLIMDEGAGRKKGEMAALVLSAAERSEAEWAAIRIAIFRALEPFDGAREAVMEALVALCAIGSEEATGDS
jgi:hypothetical protein